MLTTFCSVVSLAIVAFAPTTAKRELSHATPVAAPSAAQLAAIDIARWEATSKRVTIIRDNYGIPHVYGKTDADVVFGAIFAQAEDDFHRVERNYVNAMGRLAETA